MILLNSQIQGRNDYFYTQICEKLDLYQLEESTCRKANRISLALFGTLLSYTALIPAVLTANSFNPFPGASQISAGAVMITFGTFGADNYIDLSNIVFDNSMNEEKNCNLSKTGNVIISSILGIASRLPGAAVALEIAPGIPPSLRIPAAILSVLGTCSPEIVSTYNTISDSKKYLCDTAGDGVTNDTKNAILKHIRKVKQKLLQLSEVEHDAFTDSLNGTINLKTFLDLILSLEILPGPKISKIAKYFRKFSYVTLGMDTTFGTCCCLIQNTILTKITFDYFFSSEGVWKWVCSSICALTIAHTAFKTSYLCAKQHFDTIFRRCVGKTASKFSEVHYPKCDWMISLFSAFWSSALYGIFYESAKSSVDMNDWKGKVMFAGTYFSSYFVIYRVIQAILEKGLFQFALSSYAGKKEHQIAVILEKLDLLEKIILNIPTNVKLIS